MVNLNIKQLKRRALSKSGNYQDFKFMEASKSKKQQFKSFRRRNSSNSNSMVDYTPIDDIKGIKEPKNHGYKVKENYQNDQNEDENENIDLNDSLTLNAQKHNYIYDQESTRHPHTNANTYRNIEGTS